MAQTAQVQSDYYDERYETIEDLLARAQRLGARRVGPVEAGWTKGPGGAVYEVIAEVETADGRVARRIGRARPGDARVPDPAPAEADDQVEDRAEARALRRAIRTAYPTETATEETQAPHVRRAQALVRRAADRMGLTRDELAAIAHQRYGVESLNDLTAEQVDRVESWLEPFVTGEV